MAFRKTHGKAVRRGDSAARTAARINIVQAALALAETRTRGIDRLRRKRRPAPAGRIAAMAGGGTALAGGVLLLLRRRVAGSAAPVPPEPPTGAAANAIAGPAASNYDVAAPPGSAPATPLDTTSPGNGVVGSSASRG